VTQVVPRVLAEQGLPAGARAEQEARLRRMEEAIDAIALKVDEIARQQALMGPERGVVPTQREQLP
jgi:hypothetical protein